MKFSFMTFSCPEATLDTALELAKKYGYDGIEPRIDEKHAHGIEPETTQEQRRMIREKAAAAGVQIACVATSCDFADPASSAGHAERARLSVDLAADIGAPCVRVFGGKIGDGMSREDAVHHVVDVLSPLAEHAHKRGVTLCMETHDDWSDPVHVAAVAKAVNNPGLTVNWDIMHPVRWKLATIEKSFEILRPWISHLHVHDGVISDDGKVKSVPIGQGDIDHRTAIELISRDGYTGFVSGEWGSRSDPYQVYLPREIATLKSYIP